MALPGLLRAGEKLTARLLNAIIGELRARTLRAGPGIRLTRTPSGTTVSAAARTGCGARSGHSAAVVYINGGDSWRFDGSTPDGDEDIFTLAWTTADDIQPGTPVVALRTEDVATGHSQGS